MRSTWIFKKLLLFLFVLVIPKLDANDLPNISTHKDNSWVVSADFLAWKASEDVASIWANLYSVEDDAISWGVPSFHFKWEYGLRLGLGYNLVYDQWDTAFYWTYFRTDAKHSLLATSLSFLQPEFFAAFLSGDSASSMNGQWRILFNMFDWELGRSYWISHGLSLRPFLGLKGGWINQSIHIEYYDLIINFVTTTNIGKEHVTNNFWGIGPLGGINSKWKALDFGSHFFNLFGDFSLAAMWGTWIRRDNYKNSVPVTSSIRIADSKIGALMFRGLMGLGWDVDFSKSHFSIKIGYEMQIWLSQFRPATFQLQCLHNDLTFQGVTCHSQFDF